MNKQIVQKRKQISKKLRFEVFKRDSFTCQYCGAKAPDVILHVDHVNPVSNGGDNNVLNLITSCQACNLGKGKTHLSDDSSIQKQRALIEDLAERREQIDMMVQWREGLKSIDEMSVNAVVEAWEVLVRGWRVNENGIKEIKSLLKKASLKNILEAIDIAFDSYIKEDDSGNLTASSVSIAWRKFQSIAKTKELPDWEQKLLYIRGICRNRFTYVNEIKCLDLLKKAFKNGADIDDLTNIARGERNWTEWVDAMNEILEGD